MGKIKDAIVAYLKQNQYCVLSTCSQDTPRATPVRYENDGVTVNILSEKQSAKFLMLEKNKRVALGIYNDDSPMRGLQLWGKAEVMSHGDPEHEAALPPGMKDNPKMQAAIQNLNLIKVTSSKIVLLDQSRDGNAYLLWELDQNGNDVEQEFKSPAEVSKL
jgi:uncharacterized protein YhbP (UPF0306 family)